MGKPLVKKANLKPVKSRSRKQASGATRAAKPKTLAQINAWMTVNYGQVMEAARKNCVRLTGKRTFGGASRRKSA
jgi:hypothetical protein